MHASTYLMRSFPCSWFTLCMWMWTWIDWTHSMCLLHVPSDFDTLIISICCAVHIRICQNYMQTTLLRMRLLHVPSDFDTLIYNNIQFALQSMYVCQNYMSVILRHANNAHTYRDRLSTKTSLGYWPSFCFYYIGRANHFRYKSEKLGLGPWGYYILGNVLCL